MRNPNPETTPQTLIAQVEHWAAERGWLGSRIEIIDWVPAERRFDLLRDVDALVATHGATMETQVSMRTRFLEALLAGCPVVTSEGGTIARLVASRDAGIIVPTGNPDVLARHLAGMFDDPATLKRRIDAGRAIAGEFAWQRAMEPLLPFCRAPWIDSAKPESPSNQAIGGFAEPDRSDARSVTRRIIGRMRRFRRSRGMA